MSESDPRHTLVSFSDFRNEELRHLGVKGPIHLISGQAWRRFSFWYGVHQYSPLIPLAVLVVPGAISMISAAYGYHPYFTATAATLLLPLGIWLWLKLIKIRPVILARLFQELSKGALHPEALYRLLSLMIMFGDEELRSYYNSDAYHFSPRPNNLGLPTLPESLMFIFGDFSTERKARFDQFLQAKKIYFNLKDYEALFAAKYIAVAPKWNSVCIFGVVSRPPIKIPEKAESITEVPKCIKAAIANYAHEPSVTKAESATIRGMIRTSDIFSLQTFLIDCLKNGEVKDTPNMRLSLGALLFLAAYRQAEGIKETDKRHLIRSFNGCLKRFLNGGKIDSKHLRCLARFRRIYADSEFGRTRSDIAKFERRVVGTINSEYGDFVTFAQRVAYLIDRGVPSVNRM